MLIKELRMGERDLQATASSSIMDKLTLGVEIEVATNIHMGEVMNINQFIEQWDEKPTEDDFIDSLGEDFIYELEAYPIYGWEDESNGDFFTNRNNTESENIGNMSSFDLSLYFKYNSRILNNAYNDYVFDIAYSKAYPDYINSLNTSNNAYDTLYDLLTEYLPDEHIVKSEGYHGTKRGNYIIIEDDSSIKPQGLEIITPPRPIRQSLELIDTILEAIRASDNFFTNETTGLHINIGTWPNGVGIDLLKLSLFIGEKFVLSQFGRLNNEHTKPIITHLIDRINKLDTSNNDEVIIRMNDILTSLPTRNLTINFKNLLEKGYIEFRASGGENYEHDTKEINDTILRYVRAISVACDPKAYRKEYLKRLNSLIKKDSTIPSDYIANDLETIKDNIDKLTTNQVRYYYRKNPDKNILFLYKRNDLPTDIIDDAISRGRLRLLLSNTSLQIPEQSLIKAMYDPQNRPLIANLRIKLRTPGLMKFINSKKWMKNDEPNMER